MLQQDKIQEVKNRFEIVGNSPLLIRSLETAIKVAPTDMTILILGESGVGKENFSKIIHHLSRRKHNPFIAINCGAIPEGTIDSELFGHEKGAFTSAHEARKGYFETVDGGTIFLDEIGELPLETQSRLLRILESGEFIKVGSSKTQKTDVRVIAATNKDLYEQAQKGKFREDLYYRLSAVSIRIPPLRERKEDIPLLFAKFASDVSEKYHGPLLELQYDAMQKLQNFPWPGNIRQLKNIVEQIAVLESDRVVTGSAVDRYLPDLPGSYLIPTGNGQTNNANFQEREILYKFLFDIKKDIADLKTVIFGLLKNNDLTPNAQENINLSANLLPASFNDNRAVTQYSPPIPYSPNTNDQYHDSEVIENNGIESLSLQNQEKEMIKRALQKHAGKRKLASQELGISERTLYRKIKEYDLEEA